jgi:hypothetical protein
MVIFLTEADLYNVTIYWFVDGFLSILKTKAKTAPHRYSRAARIGTFFKQVREKKPSLADKIFKVNIYLVKVILR